MFARFSLRVFSLPRILSAVLLAALLPLQAFAAGDAQSATASGVATSGVATSGVATSGVAAPPNDAAPGTSSSDVATPDNEPDTAAPSAATHETAAPGAAAPSSVAMPAMPAPGSAVTPTNPLNMMLGLLFLLGLVALAWWFVRRTGGAQWPGARAMKVVTTLPVGARERVVLIEVGGQQILIGVAPGRVNMLHRFDEPVVTDTAGGEDFASKIRQVMQNGLHR